MLIGFYNVSVILTYLGLAFTIFGMYLAMSGNISTAFMCLILSGVCDLFDGAVARSVKRNDDEKNFGVQIDSLVDVVSYGAFPIILGISMGFTSRFNIITYILYGICAVIRLAYFNVITLNSKSFLKNKKDNFYYGLPVTNVAIILPVIYSLKHFISQAVFEKAYPWVMFVTAILFVTNFKIKKPTGIWYVICSILAVIGIAIISVLVK